MPREWILFAAFGFSGMFAGMVYLGLCLRIEELEEHVRYLRTKPWDKE